MTLINTRMLSVVHAAFKDKCRENIKSVYIEVSSEKKKITCTSTDGHILSSIQCDYYDDETFDCLLPKETALLLLKQNKEKDINIGIKTENDKKTIVIKSDNNTTEIESIQQPFPDYKQVFPTCESSTGPLSFCFDLDFFKIHQKVLKQLKIDSKPEYLFTSKNNTTPIISTFKNDFFKLITIIMPCRIDTDSATLKIKTEETIKEFQL
jgi:hypothetical protein